MSGHLNNEDTVTGKEVVIKGVTDLLLAVLVPLCTSCSSIGDFHGSIVARIATRATSVALAVA